MAHGKNILITLPFLSVLFNYFHQFVLIFTAEVLPALALVWSVFKSQTEFGLFILDGSFPMKRIKKKYQLQLPRLLQITASESPCSYTSDIAYFRWPMLGEFDPVFIVFWLVTNVFPSKCCEEQSSELRCD